VGGAPAALYGQHTKNQRAGDARGEIKKRSKKITENAQNLSKIEQMPTMCQ
jgi:hypothetical protein